MQFFSASQQSWSNSTPPQGAVIRSIGGTGSTGGARKLDCGWYDSSFDLAQGLEVSEHDSDTLYQLWELSQN